MQTRIVTIAICGITGLALMGVSVLRGAHEQNLADRGSVLSLVRGEPELMRLNYTDICSNSASVLPERLQAAKQIGASFQADKIQCRETEALISLKTRYHDMSGKVNVLVPAAPGKPLVFSSGKRQFSVDRMSFGS